LLLNQVKRQGAPRNKNWPGQLSILKRVAAAMSATTTLYILEQFWDRQPNSTAAFCFQQTSLYFTCIANGNSQMYHSSDMLCCLAESGLNVIDDRDEVGISHAAQVPQGLRRVAADVRRPFIKIQRVRRLPIP